MLDDSARAHERVWSWLLQYDLGWVATAAEAGFVEERASNLLERGAPGRHVVSFLASAGYSRDRFLLMIRWLREGAIRAQDIAQVVFSPWRTAISEAEAVELAEVAAADSDATAETISFIAQYVHEVPESRGAFRELALRLLARPWRATRGTFLEYEWSRLAEVYVADEPKLVAAAIIGRVMAEGDESFDEQLSALLRKAWAGGDKVKIFEDVLAPWLDTDTAPFASWRFREHMEGFPVHEVGVEYLERWIAERPAERAPEIAQLIGPPRGQPSTLHGLGGDGRVRQTFFAQYVSGTFWGPESTRTRDLLEGARSWLDDERQAVREWAQEVVRSLEDMLRGAEAREAEDRFR